MSLYNDTWKNGYGLHTTGSSLPNFSATANIGALTPVYLDSIVKEQNLDYLQHLAAMVEDMGTNPIWFTEQSAANKMKFLQIYQLSLKYAWNTSEIFSDALQTINRRVNEKKKANGEMRDRIISYKNQIAKDKKKYKKRQLLREKKVVQKYEAKMRGIRDQLLREKMRRDEMSFSENADGQSSNRNIYPQPQIIYLPSPYPYPPSYPEPQQFRPDPGTPMNGYPNYPPQYYQVPQSSPFMPPPPTSPSPQQQYPRQNPPPNVKHSQHSSNSANVKGSKNEIRNIKESERRGSWHQHDSKNKITDSLIIADPDENDDDEVEESQIFERVPTAEDMLDSGTGQFNQADSKNYTLGGFKSNEESKAALITSSNGKLFNEINTSEIGDKVLDLNSTPIKKDIPKLSARKDSIMLDADIDSLVQVQLKTESKVLDPNRHTLNTSNLKPNEEMKSSNHLLVSNQGNKNKGQTKFGSGLTLRDKDRDPSQVSSSVISQDNQFLKSNQGGYAAKKNNVLRDLQLRSTEDEGKKMSFSEFLEQKTPPEAADQQQKKGKKKKEEEDQYDEDFENCSDSTPEVNIMSRSPRVEDNPIIKTGQGIRFVQLKNKQFTLADHDIHTSSRSSMIESVNGFNTLMKQRKMNEKSYMSSQVSDDFGDISMPQNSIIARPSKLKGSTVLRKSPVPQVMKTPKPFRDKPFNSQPPRESAESIEQGFHEIPDLISTNVNKKKVGEDKGKDKDKNDIKGQKGTQREPKNNKNESQESETKRISIQMAHSYLYDHSQKQNDADPLKDSENEIEEDIDRNQNEPIDQSYLNLTHSNLLEEKNKKAKAIILELIRNKYKTPGDPFDESTIENEIQKNMQEGKQKNWAAVTALFKTKAEKKKKSAKAKQETLKKKQEDKIQRQKLTYSYAKERMSPKRKSEKSFEDDLSYSQSLIENKEVTSKIKPLNPIILQSQNDHQEHNVDNVDNVDKPKQIAEISESKTPKYAQPNAQVSFIPLVELKEKNKYNVDDPIEDAVNNMKLNHKTISDDDFDD